MDYKYNKKIGHYMLQRQIGSGSFAKVYKGRNTQTNEQIAIKMISKENMDSAKLSSIEKEINIMRLLQHPNVISIKDIKRTSNNIYLIMEYCHLGDLEAYINRFYYDQKLKVYRMPESAVQQVIKQLCEAFKLMRSKNIVHRDLKLANILVSKDFIVKLADFGFAKFQDSPNNLLESYCGTPITMAPEVLSKQGYTEKCDIWSLGVIMFKMLFGKYPFFPQNGGTLEDLRGIIQKGQVSFPANVEVSMECKALIAKMLMRDQEKRLSFAEFFEEPWVKGESKAELDLKEALLSVYDKGKLRKKSDIIEKDAGNIEKNTGNNAEESKTNENRESSLVNTVTVKETKENEAKPVIFPQTSNENLSNENENPNGNNNEEILGLSLDTASEAQEFFQEKFNEDFLNFVELRAKAYLETIKELQILLETSRNSSEDEETESSFNKLFGFLLTLAILDNLKSLLTKDCEILIKLDKTTHILKRSLSALLPKELYSEFLRKFSVFFQEIAEKTDDFFEVFQEDYQQLLYKMFLEKAEKNVVNEYVLDCKSLRNEYKCLIQIASFLKAKTPAKTFEIKVFEEKSGNCAVNWRECGEWFAVLKEKREKDGKNSRSCAQTLEFEEKMGEIEENYEELEREFYERVRSLDETLQRNPN